jgi:hypothetical protein
MSRITVWLHPDQADPLGNGLQALHGKFALASGGWWGVGLGGSKEKWGALPEAHTDFIFAIIGEELGLVGTLAVLGLFGVIGYAGLRVALEATEPFVRYAAAGITAWVIVQALVNIGAVLAAHHRRTAAGVLRRLGPGAHDARPGMLLSFARPRGVLAASPAAAAAGRQVGRARRRRRGDPSPHRPALAFADAVLRRDPSAEVTALGTERGLDTRIIPARGYRLIPPVPTPAARLRSLRSPADREAAAAADVLRAAGRRAGGFGGFVSGPPTGGPPPRRADRSTRRTPAGLGQLAGAGSRRPWR